MEKEQLRLFDDLMGDRETVFRICLGFSRNPWEAEELAQDVYMKAYQRINTIKDRYSARAWLFRIARNICIDFMRKKFSKKAYELDPENFPVEKNNPEFLLYQKEQMKMLKRAVVQLSKKLREVLILREYGHLSYEEISVILKIKKGTVMSRLNLARHGVKNFMRLENEKK